MRNKLLKVFILPILLLCIPPAQATTTFFGQSSSGSNNGTSCANAIAVGSVTWAAGNTYTACGNFTTTAGTVAITIGGSGTSGNPIVLNFSGSNTISSPAFPGNPGGTCSSNCGGIQAIGRSYIIMDGTGATVRNTLNGASSMTCLGGTCTQGASGSVGVFASGDHIIIRNFTINNIYISCGATNCTDSNGGESNNSGIRVDNGSTFTYICNNSTTQSYTGITTDTADSAQTPIISPSCASNAAPVGTDIFQNTLVDHCHHIQPNGQGGLNIWFNDISNWTDWIWPGTGNGCHTDGIISFSNSSTLITPNIYDNYIHGDLGIGSPTGFIFCTYNGSTGGSSCLAFNNLLVGTGTMATGNDAVVYVHSNGGTPMKYYNNTYIGGAYCTDMDGDSTTHMTWENNICVGNGATTNTWAWHQESSAQAWATLDFTNNNDFFSLRSFPWNWNATSYSSLANWTSGCKTNTGGGTGTCDDASSTGDPKLSGTWHLQAGSAAISLGANLTSLSITPLNQDGPQTFGVGASCGTGCKARPSTGAWDAGAFQFSSASGNTNGQVGAFSVGF